MGLVDDTIRYIRYTTGDRFAAELYVLDPPPITYMEKRKWLLRVSPGTTTFSSKLIALDGAWKFFPQDKRAQLLLHESAHVLQYKEKGKLKLWWKWMTSDRDRYSLEMAGVEKELRFQKEIYDVSPSSMTGWEYLKARQLKSFYKLDSISEEEIRERLNNMRKGIFNG